MAKAEWNEIPFAFKNRMEQKWIRVGEEKCLGPGLLCRLQHAVMRQISSAVALLIFNPGNIRPGKSGTEIHGYLGWLSVPLPCLCLLPGSVRESMLSQLSDNTWLTQRLNFIDMILDWKDRPWIQCWENSIFLLYPLISVQSNTQPTKSTLTCPLKLMV